MKLGLYSRTRLGKGRASVRFLLDVERSHVEVIGGYANERHV